MTRECVTHHHACDCREAKFKELEAEVTRLKTGFQGACYTCETVGELNVRLEAELAALRGAAREYMHVATTCDIQVMKRLAALIPEEVKDE